MGTNNPGVMRGMAADRRVIDPTDLASIVDAAVAGALAGALAGKADLIDGALPESQVPARLSDAEIQSVASTAAVSAVTTALSARNLLEPSFASSVALGADATAENQASFGARHLDLQPSAQPSAPTNGARLWVEVTAGKRIIKALFPTGSPVTISTEL